MTDDYPILLCTNQQEWDDWLEANQAAEPGVWLRFGKKGKGLETVSYEQAVETALCYGWIDSHVKSYDGISWIQKFTPRRARSIWSKINRGRAERLIESGLMKPAGLEQIERARSDGRWDAAYDSPGNASVPEDFQAALDASPDAAAFFETLNKANRYAMTWRVNTARRPETRKRRIEECIRMLEKREMYHGGS